MLDVTCKRHEKALQGILSEVQQVTLQQSGLAERCQALEGIDRDLAAQIDQLQQASSKECAALQEKLRKELEELARSQGKREDAQREETARRARNVDEQLGMLAEAVEEAALELRRARNRSEEEATEVAETFTALKRLVSETAAAAEEVQEELRRELSTLTRRVDKLRDN